MNYPIKKARIGELETLRAMAFFAVVLQHAIGIYISRPNIPAWVAAFLALLFNICKFAVPTFVFITAMALFYNYNQKVNYPQFIYKRFREIILPYMLWTIIYVFYYQNNFSVDYQWLTQFAGKLISGTGAYHLWFVVMIAQFYLLFPIFQLTFVKIGKVINTKSKLLVLLLGIGLFYSLLMWFSYRFLPSHPDFIKNPILHTVLVKYRDRNFVYWIYYFILGAIAGLHLQEWRYFVKSTRWLSVILFFVSFCLVSFELLGTWHGGKPNLNIASSFKPSMFVFSMVELLLIYQFTISRCRAGEGLSQFIGTVGKFSFGAYLVHALVLNLVAIKIVPLFKTENVLADFLLAAILCTLLSVGVAASFQKLPYGYFLIGSSALRREVSEKKL